MLKRLFKDLFNRELVTFESPVELGVAVERLKISTKRTTFVTLFREASVGKVSEPYVRLHRHRPSFANPFAPIFTGEFRRSKGLTILQGHFSMRLTVRIFMLVWFGLMGSFIFLTGFKIVMKEVIQAGDFLVLILSALPGLFGIGLLKFGTYCGENDKRYISKVIRESINDKTI